MSITTAVVMPATRVVPKAVNWGFGIAAVLCVITIIGIPFLLLVLVSYGLTLRHLSKHATPRVLDQARGAFRAFIGHMPKHFDLGTTNVTGKGITGTGVAYADGTVYMLDQGVGAKIPLADIRVWRWEIPGHDRVIGYGSERVAAALHTAAAEAKARSNSGLFVSVKDVEHPEWHFRCDDKAVLDRWHEILTQASEGKL
jgi:hypothetical protein